MDMLATMFTNLTVRVLGDRLAARYGFTRKLPWSSVHRVSGRLREILDAAGAGSAARDRTMAFVCEKVSGLTLSALEGFASGAAEIGVDQARRVCEILGASFDYLWLGDGVPFPIDREEPRGPGGYLSLFRQDEVEAVYFVRGNRTPHLAYVVLKYDDFRYRVLSSNWHVSSQNGHGGSVGLSELARLTEYVQRQMPAEDRIKVSGLDAPSEAVENVSWGGAHPNALWSKDAKRSYWWEDIADVDHLLPCAKKYASDYGEEFLNAQRLIKGLVDEQRQSKVQDRVEA